jgi:exonuclease III
MKILSWNCQGLGNPRTVRALKKLLAIQQPDIAFIMETKLLENQFHCFNNYKDTYTFHIVNCSVTGGGRAGGLALLWKHCNVNLEIKNYDLNYIDVLISSTMCKISWRATCIYGYPQAHNKYLTCRLINDLSCVNNCSNSSWLVFGDFNLVLTNEEKSGGNPIEPNITTSFRNTLCHCDLQDLGFKGCIYTWTNNQQGDQIIHSRLDRFLATSDWILNFPNYTNTHLVRYKSDHHPILLEFSNTTANRFNNKQGYIKRFEQVWTTDEQHRSIVMNAWHKYQGSLDQHLNHTLSALHSWGRKTFGIIPRKVKEAQDDLLQLQQNPTTPNRTNAHQINQKEKVLDDLLEKEEMWWSQRSRALWLTHGDKTQNIFIKKQPTGEEKTKLTASRIPWTILTITKRILKTPL